MNKKNNLGLDISFMDEDDPFVVFKQWMSEAEKNEINDPNAVALATVNESNQPDVRMVLLKELNNNGKTVVMITHNRDHAKAFKRTITLTDGEVVL